MTIQSIYEDLHNEALNRFPGKTIIPYSHKFDIFSGFYIDHAEKMDGECTHVFAVFSYFAEGDDSNHCGSVELPFPHGKKWDEISNLFEGAV